MNLFIGNKNKIAIEVKSIRKFQNESLMGFARVWLGGHFLGTIYDLIYLDGYLLGGLFQINKVPHIKQEILPNDAENLSKYFHNRLKDENDIEIHSYLVNFGTMADSFTIFAFKKHDVITIGWKLKDRINTDFLDLKKYTTVPFFLHLIMMIIRTL